MQGSRGIAIAIAACNMYLSKVTLSLTFAVMARPFPPLLVKKLKAPDLEATKGLVGLIKMEMPKKERNEACHFSRCFSLVPYGTFSGVVCFVCFALC